MCSHGDFHTDPRNNLGPPGRSFILLPPHTHTHILKSPPKSVTMSDCVFLASLLLLQESETEREREKEREHRRRARELKDKQMSGMEMEMEKQISKIDG